MSDTHPIHYSRPQKLVEAEEAIVTENAKAREASMSARFCEIVQAAIDEGADPVDYLRDYFNDKGDHPTRVKLQEIANAHMLKQQTSSAVTAARILEMVDKGEFEIEIIQRRSKMSEHIKHLENEESLVLMLNASQPGMPISILYSTVDGIFERDKVFVIRYNNTAQKEYWHGGKKWGDKESAKVLSVRDAFKKLKRLPENDPDYHWAFGVENL